MLSQFLIYQVCCYTAFALHIYTKLQVTNISYCLPFLCLYFFCYALVTPEILEQRSCHFIKFAGIPSFCLTVFNFFVVEKYFLWIFVALILSSSCNWNFNLECLKIQYLLTSFLFIVQLIFSFCKLYVNVIFKLVRVVLKHGIYSTREKCSYLAYS